MAATLAEIRAGLAANLATIPDVQPSGYMLANPSPPTLQVMGPDTVEYDQAMRRGFDMWTLIIQGFVGAVADIGSQENLDLWLSPTGPLSVKAALEADRTLSGTVHDLTVTGSSGYRLYTIDNRIQVLGAEWTVTVINAGA